MLGETAVPLVFETVTESSERAPPGEAASAAEMAASASAPPASRSFMVLPLWRSKLPFEAKGASAPVATGESLALYDRQVTVLGRAAERARIDALLAAARE